MPTTQGQLNGVIRLKTPYQPPSFPVNPYLVNEILAGDLIDSTFAYVQATWSPGNPNGTRNPTAVTLGTTAEGTSYTTSGADVGKVVTIVDSASSTAFPGTVTAVSNAVTILAAQTWSSLGYIGGNISAPVEYGRMQMFADAIRDSRGYGIPGNGAGAAPNTPWYVPSTTLAFSAATGSGVTMTLGAADPYALTGPTIVGRVFTVFQKSITNIVSTVATAVVTGVTDSQHATVTITGTMPLSNAASSWAVTVPLDSNGNPLTAYQIVVSTYPSAGGNGQLNNGSTYYLIWKSQGSPGSTTVSEINSANVTLATTGTVGGVTLGLQSDGVTSIAAFTLASGSSTDCTASFLFSGGTIGLSCPRDGTINIPAAANQFNPVMLAYHSQVTVVRLMDAMNINGHTIRPDTTWALRPANYYVPARIYGQTYLSHECLIDLTNALYAYPGSKVREVDYNLPEFADAEYSTNLATLFNTYAPTGAIALGLVTRWQNGANEPWNTATNVSNSYQYAAIIEAQVLSQYGFASNPITSVSQTGTTVTVVLNQTPAQLAATYNGLVISTSTTLCVYDNEGGAPALLWDNTNLASPCPVTSVTSTGSTTTFQYTSSQTQTATYAGTSMAFFMNTASNLVADGASFNAFNLTHKYYVRQVFIAQQAWVAVRPQDKFYLNVKFGGYTDTITGGGNAIQTEYPYAAYLGGGSMSWLGGISAAPYVAGALKCDVTNGSPTVANITDNTSGSSFAAATTNGAVLLDPSLYYAAGDTINLNAVAYTVLSVASGVGASITLTTNYAGTTASRVSCIINGPTPNSAANGRLWAALTANLNGPIRRQIQAHRYFCTLYGLHCRSYEGGPDLQLAPAMNVSASGDAAAGTFVAAWAAVCFKEGIEQLNYYTFTPGAYSNSSQGGWSICQDYTDTTSPKLVAWLAAGSAARNYASDYGAPGQANPCTHWMGSSGVTLQTNGNVTFNTSSQANFVDEQFPVQRDRRFSVNLVGTGSVPVPVTVYANPTSTSNGTLLGTTTLPGNGTGATTAGAAAAAIPVNGTVLTHGIRSIRVAVAASQPGAMGLTSITLNAT